MEHIQLQRAQDNAGQPVSGAAQNQNSQRRAAAAATATAIRRVQAGAQQNARQQAGQNLNGEAGQGSGRQRDQTRSLPQSQAQSQTQSQAQSPHARRANRDAPTFGNAQTRPKTQDSNFALKAEPEFDNWPPLWKKVFLKGAPQPAPLVWTYPELGLDLLSQGNPVRSRFFRALLQDLALPRGGNAFWPSALPGNLPKTNAFGIDQPGINASGAKEPGGRTVSGEPGTSGGPGVSGVPDVSGASGVPGGPKVSGAPGVSGIPDRPGGPREAGAGAVQSESGAGGPLLYNPAVFLAGLAYIQPKAVIVFGRHCLEGIFAETRPELKNLNDFQQAIVFGVKILLLPPITELQDSPDKTAGAVPFIRAALTGVFNGSWM